MRRLAGLGYVLALVALMGCGSGAPAAPGESPTPTVTTTATSTATPTLTLTWTPTVTPTATAPPSVPKAAGVLRVVDGDTVRVRLDGREETVRLIGIDTPETVDPRKPVQCFGREASARAHQLLDGQTVRIEGDPTQDTRDRYGRLLAYVWRADGRFFNLEMVRDGYAHEYTYSVPYKYQADFKAAERAAREAGVGLWSPSTCNGDTAQAAAGGGAPPVAPVAPAPPAGGAFRNCAAARAAGAAPVRRGDPGYGRHLDRDGDGIGCE